MNNDDEIREMYNALGEAVLSLLDAEETVSNQAILSKLEQFADGATDESKIMSYWQARKLFRPMAAPGSTENGPADKKSVRLPHNRLRVRKLPVGSRED